ncbi:uncharacterized protein LOC113038532 [Tachysurus ichikawai]
MITGSQLRNPNIRRTLLFHNVLYQELRRNNTTPVAQRRAVERSGHRQLALAGKVLKKYWLLHRLRQFGVSYKLMSDKKQTTHKKATYLQSISQTVKEFFVNSSCMTTDKTDTITRKNIKG